MEQSLHTPEQDPREIHSSWSSTETVMNEQKYRQVLTQFLNDYWGAFHEVLETQSVNPLMLAGPVFGALVEEHRRFAALYEGAAAAAVERLGRLWNHVAERREVTFDAPLSAKEVGHARAQFEEIYDALIAGGMPYPHVSTEVLSHAVHGHPRAPLRADAAR